jgi:hypothetical protein
MLRSWISYFLTHTLRNIPRELPNGDLGQESCRGCTESQAGKPAILCTTMHVLELTRGFRTCKGRKAVLEKLGYTTLYVLPRN